MMKPSYRLLDTKIFFIILLAIAAFFLFGWSTQIGMDGDAPISI